MVEVMVVVVVLVVVVEGTGSDYLVEVVGCW
jgi:hypothetical protein